MNSMYFYSSSGSFGDDLGLNTLFDTSSFENPIAMSVPGVGNPGFAYGSNVDAVFNAFMNQNVQSSYITGLDESSYPLYASYAWFDYSKETPLSPVEDPSSSIAILQTNHEATWEMSNTELDAPPDIYDPNSIINNMENINLNEDDLISTKPIDTESSIDTESIQTMEDEEKLPNIDEAAADIEIETGVAEAEAVEGPVGLAVAAANMITSSIGNAITADKVSDYNTQAYQNYNNSVSTGHGLGFQNVAYQNLQNSLNASSQFQTTSNLIGSIFGPAGALFSSFASPSSFNTAPVTSYTVETASGAEVNAQDASNINADSYVGSTS